MTGVLTTAAVLSATLFTSWALYITLVEHPARLDSGADAGRAQFGPSYRRAAPWQASFAAIALVSGVAAAGLTSRWAWLAGGLAVGSVIPLTLLAIRPITRRLLAPDRLDDHETIRLLRRWGRLHAVRTTLGAAGLLAFLRALGAR
ncbi:MAG TPA: DUF1772 domain-containing protein [Methylomirabilota bacterium]